MFRRHCAALPAVALCVIKRTALGENVDRGLDFQSVRLWVCEDIHIRERVGSYPARGRERSVLRTRTCPFLQHVHAPAHSQTTSSLTQSAYHVNTTT